MSRPETHDDLPDYMKTPLHLGRLNLSKAWETSDEVNLLLLGVVRGLEDAGATVDRPTGNIYAPVNPAILDQRLKAEQDRWDRLDQKYIDALESPAMTNPDERRSIDDHARDEGYHPIEWPEDEA